MFSPWSWAKNGFLSTPDSMEFVRRDITLRLEKKKTYYFSHVRNHGIGVDVHVHRITNRLGWHKPPTKNPEQTR